jgi:uncharacterized protein (DUF885 family)
MHALFRSFTLSLVLLAVVTCRPKLAPVAEKDTTVDDFARLTDEYLAVYLKNNPELAISLGFHEFDGQVSVAAPTDVATERARLMHYDSAFARLNANRLPPDQNIDYRLLTASIKNDLFTINELKSYENPLTYNLDLSAYIKRDYAPAEARLRAVVQAARRAPAHFAAARQNLRFARPPREFVAVAIESIRGNAVFLQKEMPQAFASVKDPVLQHELKLALQTAANQHTAFARFLADTLRPNAKGNYALGPVNYRKMLLYNELLTVRPDSLLRVGMEQLRHEQTEFAAAARIIDPRNAPTAVFRKLAREHPTADKLLPDTRAHCERIRQFLLDEQIVTVPSEIRATVRQTPSYMVGATAAMDPPGPFEAAAVSEAYYYVTLPLKTWTPTEQKEWLTLFSKHVSEIISIHEAYPGHYVQFLHLNASTVSRVRKIFGSYAFVEGWAHYTEQMMLEEGYGQTVDPKTAAKYRLAQLSESMLRYCRLICSINLHTHEWTVPQATNFIMANAYCARKPAYQEALRGTYDPGYLSYSLGKLQLLALRDDLKRQQGNRFSLKAFHDTVLDQGMPPISLLRQLLLRPGA